MPEQRYAGEIGRKYVLFCMTECWITALGMYVMYVGEGRGRDVHRTDNFAGEVSRDC